MKIKINKNRKNTIEPRLIENNHDDYYMYKYISQRADIIRTAINNGGLTYSNGEMEEHDMIRIFMQDDEVSH